MNTTAAAAQANVTVATIRTWCRNGVITATKRASRWIIDTASLAHRITIAAMRTRKATMSQPAQPVEIQLGRGISIRVHQETSPAYGTTAWYADKHVNGWKVGISDSGDTAEEAIEKMRRHIQDDQERAARIEALEESGLLADLSGTRTPGILAQLDGLTVAPRRTRNGECRYCGLNARTCDCR